jgi:aldehyde dehydrogenase (NAD+)
VIVAADADVDIAAKRIAWTKLVNSGQICVAPDYAIVEASVKDRFVSKVREAIETFRAEDPAGMPIVNERQFNRLSGYLGSTGGQVVIGGGSDAATLTIEPTVVVDPPLDAPLMTEEIFGPILPIITVGSIDEAIRFVNARPKPLAAYLFTKAKAVREKVIREVPAGGMLVNHLVFQVSTSKLPFGGVGPSGMGAYHGKYGFLEFSHCKSVMTKPTRPDLTNLIYPPYSNKAWKLARKFF